MAAAPKHLHELLKEDQEPFQLKIYINDRRSQLKRPTPTTTTTNKSRLNSAPSAVQIKKRKPVAETSLTNNCAISKRTLCKHACFFSFNDSPNASKSPFPDFRSPVKSPCSSSSRTKNGTVYLHVPARTAALLLEAAMRIQKQQYSSPSILKPKSQNKNMGFGLLSSIIKKLKDQKRNRKCGIQGTESKIPVTSGSKLEEENAAVVNSSDEVCSCSCNNSRLSSAGWSESNEEKSLDMETSTSSCRSQDYEEIDFGAQHAVLSFGSCESQFCSSPPSPFRFSLQKSPSSGGRRTPDFSSPAASPSRRRNEGKKILYEGNGSTEESKQVEPEEEEEIEQCSPVSVLDSPFEDEDDGHEEDHDEEEEDEDADCDDLECSFAFVQRAKEQLLYKLRRFEKLAELDPIELEKRMMEQLEEGDEDESEDNVEEEKSAVDKVLSSPSLQRSCCSNSNLDSFVNEVCIKSSLQNRRKLPTDMKRLVSDLISEENREFRFLDNRETVVGRVCKKLDSWKDVESNTIDMMVELDFRNELNEWKKFQEQRDEIAVEIEIAIFGDLLDKLSEELQ